MEKEFIPYEQALALKELGFDEPCMACYGSYVHKTSDLFLNINNPVNVGTLVREKTGFNRPTFYVKTPTFSQAFRWFREKCGLNSHIHQENRDEYSYCCGQGYSDEIGGYLGFETYEEAELECLKKIIETTKNK